MERILSLLASAAPAVWLFVGDSITQGALHTFGFRDFTQLFAERVRFELGRSCDLVLNVAVSGSTSADALAHVESVLARVVPHAAFVMLGVNDAGEDKPFTASHLQANLERISARLSDAGSAAVLQTSPPLLPSAHRYLSKFPSMMQAVREASRATAAPLIDHELFWHRYASGQAGRNLEYLMSDSVHPNACGHALLAQHLLCELAIFDPASPSCRSFIP